MSYGHGEVNMLFLLLNGIGREVRLSDRPWKRAVRYDCLWVFLAGKIAPNCRREKGASCCFHDYLSTHPPSKHASLCHYHWNVIATTFSTRLSSMQIGEKKETPQAPIWFLNVLFAYRHQQPEKILARECQTDNTVCSSIVPSENIIFNVSVKAGLAVLSVI